jgi:hypothetical protein
LSDGRVVHLNLNARGKAVELLLLFFRIAGFVGLSDSGARDLPSVQNGAA